MPSIKHCPDCGGAVTREVCASCALGLLLPSAEALHEEFSRGLVLDRYTLKRRLAAGGMGVVYAAEDCYLKRTVALKMIKGSVFAGGAQWSRFTIEAEAVATLDHPHIVPIHEVGSVDGQPFFTMKLISGRSLAAVLKEARGGRLAEREAATWLRDIAHAVHHAHQRGVLHRDLKPGNILIDDEGKAWLTDFGLAKLVHGDSGLTLSSDQIGTPKYMAPEVVQKSQREVSTASDVWALGVILWETLHGQSPFRGETPLEIMRKILDEDRSIATSSGIDCDLLTLALRCLEKDPKNRVPSANVFAEELERWLRGEPLLVRRITPHERLWKWTKRKPHWAALGAAVVVGSLVSLWQWSRAEQAVDSLTASNAQLTESLGQSEATSLAAESRLQVMEDPTRALLLAVESVDLAERSGIGELPEAAEALAETLQRIGGVDISPFGPRLGMQRDGFIDLVPALNYPVRMSPDGHWALTLDHHTDPDKVTAAVFDLRTGASEPLQRWTYLNKTSDRRAECWLGDSRRLISVDPEGAVHLWLPKLDGDLGEIDSTPSSRWLGQLEVDGILWQVDLQVKTREEGLFCRAVIVRDSVCLFQHYDINPDVNDPVRLVDQQVLTGNFARDKLRWLLSPHRHWAVGSDGQNACLIKWPEGGGDAEQWVFPGIAQWVLPTFSPDGRWLVVRHRTSSVVLMDLSKDTVDEVAASRKELSRHTGTIEAIAFSPDSNWVATGGYTAEVMVASTDGRVVRRLKATGERVMSVKFSPDGRWLGVGCREGTVTLWSMPELIEGTEPLVFRGLPTPALEVAFSPTSDSLVATGINSHYRQWRILGRRVGSIPELLPGQFDVINDLELSPDKRWIALACAKAHADRASDDGPVKLIDLGGTMNTQLLGAHGYSATGVAFSPDGQWLASTGVDGLVRVWSPKNGQKMATPVHILDMTHTRLHYPRRVAFHPRGSLYATSFDGILFEWDLNDPDPSSTVQEHLLHSIEYALPDVIVSPDGHWLAVARHGWDRETSGNVQYGNMVLLYDVSEPNLMTFKDAFPANFLGTTSVRFSQDGRWMAAGSAGHGSTVWDLQAKNIAASRQESPCSAHLFGDVAFSPDGRWLSLAGSDGRLHLWDWRSGLRPRTLVTGLENSALTWLDDSRLIVGDTTGTVAIWETNVDRLKVIARNVAGRELSASERDGFGSRH